MGAEKRTVFWGFASLLAILFIFSNSIKSGADSMAQSDVIVASVESIWSSANERESLPEETHLNLSVLVRKMAHFIEFSVLGFSVGAFFLSLASIKKRKFDVIPYLFCLSVACLDELLQRFSGRTESLRDVVLDWCGSIFGLFIVVAISKAFKRVRARKEKMACANRPM